MSPQEQFLARLIVAKHMAWHAGDDRLAGLVWGYINELLGGRPFSIFTDCTVQPEGF